MGARRSDRSDTPGYRETITRFWLLRLEISVDGEGVELRFRPLPWGDRRIGFDEIDEAAVATYSAATYGGWHWGVRRTLGGNAVYRLGGRRGVELRLTDGSRVFVGSRRPAELVAALEGRVGRPF